MPARNSIKDYVNDGYYHLYNRGVEKRLIFQDDHDYAVFLSYLKDYLLPKDTDYLMEKIANKDTSYKERDNALKLIRLNNFTDEITLLAFCLMANHFHFLIKQKAAGSIDKFVNSIGTRYTMYFNRKYKRVGSLYQGVYKAVLIKTDEQLLHLSRYIHKQALASQGEALRTQPCSYKEYLGLRKTIWVNPKEILSYFSDNNKLLSYESFIKQGEEISVIKDIKIDD